MALDGAAGPSDGPAHAIDGEGTATAPDLAVGDGGRQLHADAKHLADVARELSNLADYLDKDLGKAAKQIVELSGLHAGHHYGGAMSDWNNPSGRFGDADYLWARYGDAALSTREFAVNLGSAIKQLAGGTELIAKRYSSTEARNRLLAKQVDSLLNTKSSGAAVDASTYGEGSAGEGSASGGDAAGDAGADSGGQVGAGDAGRSSGNGGGSTSGYGGGGDS